MREMKFRAWIPQVKEWLADVTLKDLWQSGRAFEEHGDSRYETENMQGISWKFDDLLFMQYTGLKDKSGCEIYEGDILKSEQGWTVTVEAGFSIPIISIFMGRESGVDSPTLFSKADHFEIIGNIYENPELMKAR